MNGAFLRRRDRTARLLRVGHYSSAVNTYRKIGPNHAERYLASFAWRYNRRYQLQTMIPRFVHSAARTQPMPYPTLIAG